MSDLPDICRNPVWRQHWEKAGLYEAVCQTHAIEQAILRNLHINVQANNDAEIQDLVKHLIEMGHSMQAIDKFVQDGGFGSVAKFFPEPKQ